MPPQDGKQNGCHDAEAVKGVSAAHFKYANGNDEFVCHLNQGAAVESRMTAIPTAVRPESLIYEQLGDDLGVGDDFVREGIFSAVVGESEAGMVEAEGV
jgi:hypothetical protein